MCNCREEINAKITKMFIESTPKSKEHKASLLGYGIRLTDKGCVEQGYMPYETYALVPLAKGGNKPKKSTGNMFFSYCPFCGEKHEDR